MRTTAKTSTALLGSVALALLLASCATGGAQNPNPVATGPRAENTTKSSQCDTASSAAVDAINALTGRDDLQSANSEADGDVWYLGTTTGSGDDVALWATTVDPTTDDFAGTVFPINATARDEVDTPTATASPAPKTVDPESAAASRVENCVTDGSGQ